MMRTPELLERAAEWKMPIITIEALQKYLMQKKTDARKVS
jgi:3,4-dihydroxy-2-butanone 4-phosphate synthase